MPQPHYMSPLARQTVEYVNPHVHSTSSASNQLHTSYTTTTSSRANEDVDGAVVSAVGATSTMVATSAPLLPQRSFPSNSVEQRLLELIHKHNHVHGSLQWGKKLDLIDHHAKRFTYLDTSQIQFLEVVHDRASRFLHNIDELVTSAALELVPVDRGVLRTVSGSWETANVFSHRSSQLLAVYRRTNSTGVGGSGGGSPAHHPRRTEGASASEGIRSTTPRTLQMIRMPHRTTSPSASLRRVISRGPDDQQQSPIPGTPTSESRPSPQLSPRRALNVLTPDRRFTTSPRRQDSPRPASSAMQQRVPGTILGSPSTLSLSSRKEVLETIEAIGFGCIVAGEMKAEALAEAKQCFVSLYGQTDGHRRFMRWCDEQTIGLMRSHAY